MTVSFDWTPKKPPPRLDNEPDWSDTTGIITLLAKTEANMRKDSWLSGGLCSKIWHEKWFVEDEGRPMLANMSRWLAVHHNIYLSTFDLRMRIMSYDTIAVFAPDLIEWVRGFSPNGAYELARAIQVVVDGNPVEWVDEPGKLKAAEVKVREIKRVLDAQPRGSIKSMWAALREAKLIPEGGRVGPGGPHTTPDTVKQAIAKSDDGLIDGDFFIPRLKPRKPETERRWTEWFQEQAEIIDGTRDDVFRNLVEDAIRQSGIKGDKAA